MYYRIKKTSNLSSTSYRACVEDSNNKYIEYNEGYVGDDWEEVTLSDIIEVFGVNPFAPPPTQLDRIETQLDDADTIQAELLFNQANADIDTQLILETLAEILLNQQGV